MDDAEIRDDLDGFSREERPLGLATVHYMRCVQRNLERANNGEGNLITLMLQDLELNEDAFAQLVRAQLEIDAEEHDEKPGSTPRNFAFGKGLTQGLIMGLLWQQALMGLLNEVGE